MEKELETAGKFGFICWILLAKIIQYPAKIENIIF